MDDEKLTWYVRELTYQTEAAQLATSQLNAALKAPPGMPREQVVPRGMAAVQALLSAGALISKLLWPPSTASAAQSRGEALRTALQVLGTSVLARRDVRNSFEHFDERLDKYLANPTNIVLDQNMMPRNLIETDGPSPVYLRSIDPMALTVSVLDVEIGLQEFLNAIDEVGQAASAWLEKNDPNSIQAVMARLAAQGSGAGPQPAF